MILEHDARWNYKKKVNYFLQYKFPIEQLLSQNKFISITKMYFISESKYRKKFSQENQIA